MEHSLMVSSSQEPFTNELGNSPQQRRASARHSRIYARPPPAEMLRLSQEDEDRNAQKVSRTHTPPFSIHPYSELRQRWDFCTIIFIGYCAIWIPFNTAFVNETFLWAEVVEQITDVFFWVDIFLNFVTGVEVPVTDDETVVSFDKQVIAWKYLKGWFVIDVASSFPFYLFVQEGEGVSLLKTLKLWRLIRLARIMRLARIIQRLESSLEIHIPEGVQQIITFFMGMLMVTHWFACCFFAIGNDNDGPWATGVGLQSKSVGGYSLNYFASTYWAIMTLTTVGYGDVSAINTEQRLLGIIAMIVGAVFFAYGVSHVVNIVEELRSDSVDFKKRLDKFSKWVFQLSNMYRLVPGLMRSWQVHGRKEITEGVADPDPGIPSKQASAPTSHCSGRGAHSFAAVHWPPG